MAMLRKLMILAITAMFMKLAMAATYPVGGPNGSWDLTTDLQTWASSHSFMVGNNLLFQYTSSHNVLEVTKTDYDSCQTSNAIHSYSDGSTTIPLSAPGKRYFICGVPGHCGGGMKVEIDTLTTTSPPPASPPTTRPVSPTSPKPATPSTPPAASPVSPPSPVAPTPSPTESPNSAPTVSPPSPPQSPKSSTAPSPNVPSPESSADSPHPSVAESSPKSSLSSAYKSNVQAMLAMGFGVVMIFLVL